MPDSSVLTYGCLRIEGPMPMDKFQPTTCDQCGHWVWITNYIVAWTEYMQVELVKICYDCLWDQPGPHNMINTGPFTCG